MSLICPYCRESYHSLGIMKHRKACREKIHPGINCKCAECRKVGEFLRAKEEAGEINIVGCKEDLEKL